MKRLMMSIILAVIPLWTLEGVYAQDPGQPAKAAAGWNQYHCPKHPEISASWPGKCPKCGANLVPRRQPGRMTPYRPRAMEMRRRIMMNTSIDVFDPEAILCAKRPLGLTREQVEQLRAISTTARQCAEEVLTDKQRSELNSLRRLPNYPRTMAQMHRRMMQQQATSQESKPMKTPSAQASESKTAGKPGSGSADPPARARVSRGRAPNTAGNLMRNRYRDQLRDRYRDYFRDRFRDRLRDRDRDRLRDRYFYANPYGYGYNYYYPYYNPYYYPYNYGYNYYGRLYHGYPYYFGPYPYFEEYSDNPNNLQFDYVDYFGDNDEGFGDDEGFGGDEGFGDDEGFGGDEGFGDDEGFGGDEGFGNDEGFGGEEGFGGDEGFGDDEGFGGDEGFGDDEGFGGDEGFGDDEGFGGDEGLGGDEGGGDEGR